MMISSPKDNQDSTPYMTKTPQVTQDTKNLPKKYKFDFQDGDGYYRNASANRERERGFLNESRASIERSLRDIDLVF